MEFSRRAWITGSAAAVASLGASRVEAALRVPTGGALRLPLPAPRLRADPARAVDQADAWTLALTHESLVTALPDGTYAYPLLAGPPAVDRADPRVAALTLRAGMAFSNGAPVTAAAVLESWRAARASPLGRLALSRLATMNPFEARGDLDLVVRLAVPGTLDESLAAWPLAVAAPGPLGPTRPGVGPFVAQGADGASLARNPRCPTGPAFLERVSFEAPRPRNEELRAFTTGALDASWWGNSLYEVRRPADPVRGSASVVVGLVPSPGGPLVSASAARTLERVLAALAAGDGAVLSPMGFAAELSAGAAPDLPALVRAVQSQGSALRVAREASDGSLDAIAERVVALLDAVGIPATLVNNGDASHASLRAVAPLAADAGVALASFLAAAAAAAGGDEAGASAIVRTPRGNPSVAAGVWGRGVVAVLGRASPVLHVRAGVRDARFDGAGRVLLGDAWIARG